MVGSKQSQLNKSKNETNMPTRKNKAPKQINQFSVQVYFYTAFVNKNDEKLDLDTVRFRFFRIMEYSDNIYMD